MRTRDGILLESGTNEVEVLEFRLGGQGFGVNVLKIQSIELFDPDKVTRIQMAHAAVAGTYNYRDGVICLVDLGKALAVQPDTGDARIVLVLEFNGVTTGFLVDGVDRIHRVDWDAISPLSPFLAEVHSRFTGSMHIDRREILVVDMERILAEILPATSGAYEFRDHDEVAADAPQAGIPVFLAEDSVTIRGVIINELKRGGYTQVRAFDNGLACFEAVREEVDRALAEQRPVSDLVGLVVSDIEMPRMDGMTLCRRLKTDLDQPEIPVILFSSLINEQTARKCEAVGADAYIGKPRFHELLEQADALALHPVGCA